METPDAPSVLKAQGSGFVGGEKVEPTQGELGIANFILQWIDGRVSERTGATKCHVKSVRPHE